MRGVREQDRARSEAWKDVRRVLAIRLDSMGDLLMTTPALAALAEGGCDITLLTSPQSAEAARHVPVVSEVLAHAAPWMPSKRRATPSEERLLLTRLRLMRFDAAVIFTVCTQDPLPAAYLAFLAEVPLRLAHEAQPSYGLISQAVADPDCGGPLRHETQRQLDLVASVGFHTRDQRMRFAPGPKATRKARHLLGSAGEYPLVCVHPSAAASSRRYSTAHFGEVCALLREAGCVPIVIGGSRDRDVVDAVKGRAAGSLIIGDEDVGTLGALLERCDVFVGNNSGPAHVAAAVGTPCVVAYAGTNLQHQPWGVASHVLRRPTSCTPCLASTCGSPDHACLDIPPERIVEAVLDLCGYRGRQVRRAPRDDLPGPPPRVPAPMPSSRRDAAPRDRRSVLEPAG